MNKVYITSNGCAVLWNETERIAKYFRLNGWKKVSTPADADIIVVTCCGVTHNEENQAISMIGKLENCRKSDSLFVVSGCLPSFAGEYIKAIAPGARLMTYKQLEDFDKIIQAKVVMSDVYYNAKSEMEDIKSHYTPDDDEQVALITDAYCGNTICKKQYDFCTLHHYVWQSDDVYQIKVSYGCPGKCSYCATKLAIGDFRSVPKTLVMKQFSEGISAGYKRFLLIGDEIGCYGSDLGINIINLLHDVYTLQADIKIAIRYIHPDIFVKYYKGLRPYFANGFIEYFCCAIQSASPAILKAMNRNPNIEPFIHCMEDININRYKVNKHTQILVGFPGETEADVLATLQCLIRCNFDHININKFSPRRGTKAYDMTDNVPETIKVERCNIFRTWMNLQKQAKMYEAMKQSLLLKNKR